MQVPASKPAPAPVQAPQAGGSVLFGKMRRPFGSRRGRLLVEVTGRNPP